MKRFLSVICSVTILITAATSQITAYQPGERILYTIHYGPITGGEVTLELQKDTASGTELWH